MLSSPPIIDLRQRLGWRRRLPGRLGTGALWVGSLSLFGPFKLAGLLLVGGLLAPALTLVERRLERQSRQPLHRAPANGRVMPMGSATSILPRAQVAAELGLPETLLFRARHGAICTVHHGSDGSIVALDLPAPDLQPLPSSTDAHPVG